MTVIELKKGHYEILSKAQDIQGACVRAFLQLDDIARDPSKADAFELFSIQTRLGEIRKCADKILLEVAKMKGDQT